jgi:hypothetical protein
MYLLAERGIASTGRRKERSVGVAKKPGAERRFGIYDEVVAG